MSREEMYMICRFLNAYNTRQTAQTRPRCTLQSFRISKQFCKLEDLMTFMIYISGCERLLFSGWKLVNFSKCIKQHQECFLLKTDCVKKSVICFSIFYFLLVCLFLTFWRSLSATGENTYNIQRIIIKLSKDYIFKKIHINDK